MKQAKPLPRLSKKKLAALNGKPVPFSTITKPSGRPKSVNPKAKAKRTARYRKMLSGKEYQTARAEALARAGNRCEQWMITGWTWWPNGKRDAHEQRCEETTDLHAHHLRYPKSRPLAASDLKILCKHCHGFVEAMKMHKTRMF